MKLIETAEPAQDKGSRIQKFDELQKPKGID